MVSEPARESEPGGRFFEPARVAGGQHGVFHLTQVALSARAVQKRAGAGTLHRQHAGVYSIVPRQLLKREGLYMAAVLACGPGAVLSHHSAAVLHQLRDWGATTIHVTVPRRSRRKHPGVTVHCSTTLTDADVTVEQRIPCTSVARTLLDLADAVTHRQLEWSFDQAELHEALDLNAIADQLARNPTRAAANAVRQVLDEHYIGKTATANENEELLLSITRGLGLPDPETNQYLALPDGGPPIKADFLWRAQRVIVEADSGKWHHTRQRIENDRRRDQRLTAAGWTVIRTSWRQMTYQPDELRKVLLKLLPPPGATSVRTRSRRSGHDALL